MKHYKEDFYVSEEINKETAVKLKPEYFERRNIDAERKGIMLDSWYDVSVSGIEIDKDGAHKYWHLRNLDKSGIKDRWLRENINAPRVVEDEICDSEYPFKPGPFEFDAPEIGEHYYLWEDGSIFVVEVTRIRIEIRRGDELRVYYAEITLTDVNGVRHRIWEETCEDLIKQFNLYCRKCDLDFDNDFWHDRYEELRTRKDEEYDELYDEYGKCRDWD
jgi:hypothetical protein